MLVKQLGGLQPTNNLEALLAGVTAFVVHGTYPVWGTLAAVMVVAGVLETRRINDLLEARPFVWLGKLSFSLYLFHLPIILTLGTGLYAFLVERGQSHTEAMLYASGASVLASLVVAAIATCTLDAWSTQSGKWIDNRFFAPAARTT